MNTTALKTEIGELDFPVAPSFVMDFEEVQLTNFGFQCGSVH
jgi:hypothetical protein